jgi:hypothetical protein
MEIMIREMEEEKKMEGAEVEMEKGCKLLRITES